MANYKKLTDVEVMEKTTENSMAIIEENGVLKRVPAGGFGSGGNIINIVYDEVNDTFSCETTATEFLEMIESKKPYSIVLTYYVGGGVE